MKLAGGGAYLLGNVGIWNTSPSYLLDVSWTGAFTGFRLTTGASTGYVLTTDASGNARWDAAPSGW
jgi:hypothetical protein